MKLKKVVINSQVQDINNFPFGEPERFKTCRYCRYYECGKCYNKKIMSFISGAKPEIYDVSESGRLSDTIRETAGSCDTKGMKKELIDLLKKWKVSSKRIEEFEHTFDEVLEQWLEFSLRDDLDEAISILYETSVDTDNTTEGVEISNPSEYSCKEFM